MIMPTATERGLPKRGGARIKYFHSPTNPGENPAKTGKPFTVRVPHPGSKKENRAPKVYVLRFDANAETIVSYTVLARLQEAAKGGYSAAVFQYINDVESPPAQRLVAGDSLPPRADRQAVYEVRRNATELYTGTPNDTKHTKRSFLSRGK